MIKKYRYRPLVKTYSIIIIHLCRPGSFLKILYFSTISNIKSLAPISYIRPISSIFHRSAYITFLIAGKLRNRNYIWITSVVAPLIQTVSIWQIWRILTYRLQCKKLSNQCFFMPVAELPARKIRLTNIRICTYIGVKPRVSWI